MTFPRFFGFKRSRPSEKKQYWSIAQKWCTIILISVKQEGNKTSFCESRMTFLWFQVKEVSSLGEKVAKKWYQAYLDTNNRETETKQNNHFAKAK